MVSIDKIKNMVVIGGGIMGSGIAQVALLAGYEKVTVVDLNAKILHKSKVLIQERIEAFESEENFKKFITDNGIMDPALISLDIKRKLNNFESVGILANGINTETIMSRLSQNTEIAEGVKNADFVIEAVTEKLELKQNIFRDLGQHSPPNTILASNTSAINITEIAKFSGRPEKVIGMHFHTFFPIMGMLIEITPGKQSSKESLDIGQAIGQKFPCLRGKRFTIQLEKEAAGLIANRISLPSGLYFDWLLDFALDNGFSFEQLGALNPMFGLADAIGLDTIHNIMKYFEKNVSPDFAPGNYFTKLINEGKLGKKVGKGYLKYAENGSVVSPPITDEEVTEFLMPLLNEDIFLALSLNEACRLLEEGVAKSSKLIDKIIFKGTSVPGPFRRGKKKYKELSEKLYVLTEKTGKSYFKPCKMLESGKFLDF
ncbi:MAG: 3-hydroxyacyl-CoA dehydrogenase NAD-binding domain-containing protein [Candidatus Thorarchaeota archaeon]